MYSQNNEEEIILNYFKTNDLTVLDIGANDGKTFSNSLKVIENGWNGILVEPSIKAFNLLSELHKNNSKVQCFNIALLEKDKPQQKVTLYDSGPHIPNGKDISIVSSLLKESTNRWKAINVEFTEVSVYGFNFNDFIKNLYNPEFNLISIDVEGLDYEILTQIDLNKYNCQMVIVETNSINDKKYIEYCEKYQFKLFHKNAENLIFIK